MKIIIIIVIIIITIIIIITKLKKVHLSHPLRDSFCMGIRCVVRACPSRRCLDLLSRQMCRLEDGPGNRFSLYNYICQQYVVEIDYVMNKGAYPKTRWVRLDHGHG
jgi:hypothetical protein